MYIYIFYLYHSLFYYNYHEYCIGMNMQHLSALLCFFWSSLYDIYGMVCLVAFPWNTCGMATNQNASQPKTRYCPASEQNTLDQFQIYSTINYDPALKFTTRITFLTSIPPAECYGRDPEVYSVYLHVEPCRASGCNGGWNQDIGDAILEVLQGEVPILLILPARW